MLKLSNYFVSLPPVRYFLVAIVILGIVFGIAINVSAAQGADLLIKGALDGLLLLTLPALLSALSVKLMIFRMPFKRIAALVTAAEVIYALAYGTGYWLASVNPFYAQLAVIFGAALVFILWYVIARLVFTLRYRSLLFAGIQLLFHLAFLLSSQILYFESEVPLSVAKFYLAAVVLLAAVYVFFFIINAPMKKNIGISSTDAIALFAAQWLSESKELEKTFARIGERAKTLLGMIAFKRKNDTVLFLVPYVHFGPFGNLGGSEFSALIPQLLRKRTGVRSFVFHGTVTHDLNPISSKEIDHILETCREALKEARFRPAKVSFVAGRSNECRADLLRIGDSGFIGFTRAPYVTEDINFGVGLGMMAEAEKQLEHAIAVDQHNCETGEVTTFDPGGEVSFNYLQAMHDALRKKGAAKPLRLGVAERYPKHPLIANGGIRIAAISSDPLYLLVLIDCNGITPSFRERMIQEVENVVQAHRKKAYVAIYTTDTHKVNSVRGVLNPLREDKNVQALICGAAREALMDMQPARMFAAKKWFGIRVIGAKHSIEIVSTINSIIAIAKIVAPLLLLGGIAAILFLLSHLG